MRVLRVYDLGPFVGISDDELEEAAKAGVEWVVYYYSVGYCNGDGIMVWKKGDKLGMYNMLNFQCHGPVHGLSWDDVNAMYLVLHYLEPNEKDNYDDYNANMAVYRKVWELCWKADSTMANIPVSGSNYPGGPCALPIRCSACGKIVAKDNVVYWACDAVDDCEICEYCSTAKCPCGQHLCCGGCV